MFRKRLPETFRIPAKLWLANSTGIGCFAKEPTNQPIAINLDKKV